MNWTTQLGQAAKVTRLMGLRCSCLHSCIHHANRGIGTIRTHPYPTRPSSHRAPISPTLNHAILSDFCAFPVLNWCMLHLLHACLTVIGYSHSFCRATWSYSTTVLAASSLTSRLSFPIDLHSTPQKGPLLQQLGLQRFVFLPMDLAPDEMCILLCAARSRPR